MSFSRALGVVTALTLTATTMTAAPAAAAPPTIERQIINETFTDPDLVSACGGIPITVTVSGFQIDRRFQRDGAGVQSVLTLNLTATAVAGDNTYRFKDVRTEVVRQTRNGDEILLVSGQIPFGFKGALRINLTTDELLHEPRERRDRQFAEACAVLTA
jgi:hypothetical protein